MNFSLRTLLIFMALMAVVAASLSYPTSLVGDCYYTLGLTTIAMSMVAAFVLQGSKRAYWMGFVIAFVVYFGSSVSPMGLRNPPAGLGRMMPADSSGRELITTRMVSYLFDVMHPSPGPGSQGRAMHVEEYASFLTVGHTAIALLFGVCGGAIARRIYSRTVPVAIDASKETPPCGNRR
jgi:hypothetical protein